MSKVERELPQGWLWATFSEICEINPKHPADILPVKAPVTFVPMAAIDEVTGTIAKPGTKTYGEVRKGYTHFSEGDVLFAKITPCMENGKSAIARNLVSGIGFGTTELHVLRPFDGVLSEYVYHYVRQQSFRNQAAANMTGTAGQLRVPWSYVQKAKIPLCPTSEQKRIVAVVRELLFQIRTARQSLENARLLIKELRQSVLAKAFRGELIERDPNDESAQHLIGRIEQERRENWEEHLKKKGKDPRKLKYPAPRKCFEADLPKIPGHWMYVSLESVCSKVENGATPLRSNSANFDPKGLPLIKVENITRNGKVVLREDQLRITREAHQKQSRSIVFPNDVLVNIVGPPLGKVGIITKEIEEANINQAIVLMRTLPSYHSRILLFCLLSPFYYNLMVNMSKGVRQSNIRKGDVGRIPVPLIPLSEQRRILSKVEECFSFTDDMEKSVREAKKRVEMMDQSILAKAFRGELVPQDPNDEPASVLLERIQAQRMMMTKKGRRRALEEFAEPAAISLKQPGL